MWRRWTCCLGAVLLISACSHGTLTRVVRTDGTTVVGELTAARPDAVVIKLADGTTVTIPRGIIKSIESATAPSAPAAAANTGGKSGNPAATQKSGARAPVATATPPAMGGSTPSVATTTTRPATNNGPTKPAREAVAPSGTTLELALSTAIGRFRCRGD
jgi:hypothetical protein